MTSLSSTLPRIVRTGRVRAAQNRTQAGALVVVAFALAMAFTGLSGWLINAAPVFLSLAVFVGFFALVMNSKGT